MMSFIRNTIDKSFEGDLLCFWSALISVNIWKGALCVLD